MVALLIQIKKMAKASGKKRNFIACELEELLSEVEESKNILFGSLSSAINSKCQKIEWENGGIR